MISFFFHQRAMTNIFILTLFFFFGVCPQLFAEAPTVTIAIPADGASFNYKEFITFNGSAIDATDNDAITDYEWISNLDGSLSTDWFFSAESERLSIGTHTITLKATDASGEIGLTHIQLHILNNAPTALITGPNRDSTHVIGQPIIFTGTGDDTEDGLLADANLSWTSSEDGPLGTGLTLEKNDLSVGSHTITFTVTDSKGSSNSTAINITVSTNSPTVTISNPINGNNYLSQDAITFVGSAVDPEDGDIEDADLTWNSSKDGLLGTGGTFSLDTLTLGTHTITLTAKDRHDQKGSASIIITINEDQGPSNVEITDPEDGTIIYINDQILFLGSAFDTEGGELNGSALVWTSSLSDSPIGTGISFSTNTLALGEHLITLTATDSKGSSKIDTIRITVANRAPEVTIYNPIDNSSHLFQDSITFVGSAVDPEDGDIEDANLTWNSSKDGLLGTGGTLSSDALTLGTHIITLTAKDSDDQTGSKSVTITVYEGQESFVVKITNPVDGFACYVKDPISFEGNAFDSDGNELLGSSLVWTSNFSNTPIGTGTRFLIDTLTAGEHIITLTATDSNGLSHVDFIVITVNNTLPDEPIITHPLDNSFFDEGETIAFRGSANDTEDGLLTGSSLVWQSDKDRVLGIGLSFVENKLSPGTHSITLKAKDNNGGTSEKSITITVLDSQQGKPLTLTMAKDKDRLIVPQDLTGQVEISGGTPPYKIEKDLPDIIDADLVDNIITVTPREKGNTTIRVYDHLNYEIVLKITVTANFDELAVAHAGADQSVVEGETVTLDGSLSLTGSSGVSSWQWSQVDTNTLDPSSTPVVLSNSALNKVTFVAPVIEDNSTLVLTFLLTLSNLDGYESTDEVTVTVSDNGISAYPQGVTTFLSASQSNPRPLGVKVVGDGDLILLKGAMKEFVNDFSGRPEYMPYDLIDLNIKVKIPGDSAHFIVYFPEALPDNYECYKYSTIHGWYLFNGGIQYDYERKKVYLSLMDGGPGDDDGIADGVISDPLTFGTPSQGDPEPEIPDTPDVSDSSGGGGGGGCFIKALLGQP